MSCPVCFGASDAPIAHASNAAILTLVGFTGVVLAGCAAFVLRLVRRAGLSPSPAPAEATAGAPAPDRERAA
jgi:hypothetical protein